MAKGKKTKKKNWKLRRQLRKTFGCLFMISALIVTAIPVQPTEASPGGTGGWTQNVSDFSQDWVTSDTANIPDVLGVIASSGGKQPPVYYDEQQRYRFVYVDSSGKWDQTSSTIKSAVIVGFVRGALPNEIIVPAKVDAYIRYMDTSNPEAESLYAAANKQGRPLYYKTKNTTRSIQNEPVLTSEDLNGDKIINDYIYPETGEYAYSKTDDFVEPEAETFVSGRAAPDFGGFRPCTPETKATWQEMDVYYYDEGNGVPPAGAINQDETDNPKWKVAYGDDVGRIADADVEFIGNYCVTEESDNIIKSSATASVFGGTQDAASNITTIKFGLNDEKLSPLRGIGNYAFYGCRGINSVQFGNGLATLGNYAFGNCINMQSATLVEQLESGGTTGASLKTLGAGAFYNCQQLATFIVPYSVMEIGDFCFKGCSSLKDITLTPDSDRGLRSSLEKIGYRAFEDCESLQSLTLPAVYKGAEDEKEGGGNVFHISTVKGCKSLAFIKTFDRNIEFVSDAPKSAGDTSKPGDGYHNGDGRVDGNYDFAAFKNDVGEGFWFEAPGYISDMGKEKTPTHNVANVYHICFKYLGEDRYEIVEDSHDVEGNPVGLVYQVNGSGSLIKFQVENPDGTLASDVRVPEIIMPENVGKIGIVAIMEGSFDHNCFIQKVVIPGTVTEIGANAFKGSHNLKHIIFSDAANIQKLGKDAFATQVIDSHHGDETFYPNTCEEGEDFLKPDYIPFLSFTGTIEKDDGTNTEPFKYAMRSTSNINEGQQQKTYITYYSGIPTNLTVQYNDTTGKAELLHFPSMKDIDDGFQFSEEEKKEYGNGAYQPYNPDPNKTSGWYRYPYMTDDLAQQMHQAANGGALSEDMSNILNSVENIVIPTGVTGVKEGLFSGLNADGKIIGGKTVDILDENGDKIPELDDDGNPKTDVDGNPIYQTKTVDYPDETYVAPAKDVKTLTTKSLATIDPYTFGYMPELTSAYVSGTTTIGNYAFDECPKLEYAEIGSETDTLGLRPFSGCDQLSEVKFNSNPYFTAENGVIFAIDGNGTKTKVMQCLPGRGGKFGSMGVGPDEFAGIQEIAPEAFMDCPEIREVDLSTSVIKTIPEKCFAESKKLNNVRLPNTVGTIQNGSFWNTDNLYQVLIPGNTSIANDAFASVPKEDGVYGKPLDTRSQLDFVTPADGIPANYASLYSYINVKENEDMRGTVEITLWDAVDRANPKQYDTKRILRGDNLELTILDIPDHTAEGYRFSRWDPDPEDINPIYDSRQIWAMYEPIEANTYTVRFFDINKEEMKDYTQQVEEGKDAVPPSRDIMNNVEGKVFTGWDRAYTEIKGNVDIYAQYADRAPGKYYVTFYTDSDLATVIGKMQEVDEGDSAIEPAHPTKEGYTFSAWSSDGWKNVTRDWDIFAVYTQNTTTPDDPNKPDNPNDPNKKPNDSNNSNKEDEDKDKDKDKDKDSVSENATKYKVTVNGGSGSGDYTAGTIVPINAYARADGTVFDKWTSSSNGVGFVNQTAISTTFTMPANNVEITANFKADTSSVSGNSRSARRNSTTTVDVNKSGISNTGLASANVNGSSDNFVVRITDDAQATSAVIAALEGKYGNLSNIAYLPMDISLYDSTGQTKITDVSGISVDITLPLPDGLIQYAGNNRAASVVNGRLEDLATKFTTIDGVPCVQFTATHFSPYTIYVDKANLTEGLIDATPKTGDPIHPKWFLAMGLACISIILFCKKDKRQPKVKAA